MNKLLPISCLTLIFILLATPVLAKPLSPSTTDRQLANLNSRFSNLEANWGRFQLGGNLNLDSSTSYQKTSSTFNPIKFKQELSIYLDTFIDSNLQLSVKMYNQGGWGLNYQSAGTDGSPLTTPLQIDEAYLRLSKPDSLDYLGRFRFSLGPLGVISDFIANPAEGVAIQKEFDNYHIIGFYSRINTQYLEGTDQIASQEDYWATRISWNDQTTVWGLNIVPNGITGEKAFSLDWSLTRPTLRTAAELGWYSFSTSAYPDYKVAWTPGLLISFGNQISPLTFWQIKMGYFSPQFTPSYSSLAHSAGDNREWFLPNTKGIELYALTGLTKKLQLENRLIILTPVKNYTEPDLTYHLRTSLIKSYSSANQLQVGLDLKTLSQEVDNQFFVKWNLQF